MSKIVKFISPFAFALLSACGGGSGGGSNDNGVGTGSLSLGVTDGPVEWADAVVVSFDSVELQGAESKVITFLESKTVNLLDYQGKDRILLLNSEELTAGAYQWIRLGVVEDESYIEINGEIHDLDIPSGSESGLKMNRGFTVVAGSETDFTIDFDLRKSVHQTGDGDYKLRPTLRLIDNIDAGSIEGTVADDLVTDAECKNGDNNDTGNAVYLYTGTIDTPLDIRGSDSDPVASATATYSGENEQYEFIFGFIAPGDYTAAFTCDATLDITDEDNIDVVSFGTTYLITVDANEDVFVEVL